MRELEVEFTCPICGVQWSEWQNPDDDWFGLATNQTLCPNCGEAAMKRIIDKTEDQDNEVLSSWPRSHR